MPSVAPMRTPGQPARVVIKFACPADRVRPVILALAAMTLAAALTAAMMRVIGGVSQ